MLNKLRNDKLISGWKTHLLFAFIVLMLAGLFFSRFVLSASMIGFIIVCFLHTDPRSHFANFLHTPLLWGMSLLFFIPLLSGTWSEDKEQWWEIVKIKMPLLFLPLAFAGPIPFSKKNGIFLASVFVAVLLCSTMWTMYTYLGNPGMVNASYLEAKTMMTPLGNDHVRYSWLISIGVFVCAALFVQQGKERTPVSFVWLFTGLWFLVFLHILSARTGLLSVYLMGLITIIWLSVKNTNWKTVTVLIVIITSLPFLAYKTIPSFQNKLKFFLYEKGFFEKANYLPGSTDAVRVISLKAGWGLLNEEPLMGKGFGDVREATKKWYTNNYPEMIEADRIDPSSEWMMYGAGAGWPGFLFFTISMLLPFFTKVNNKLPWFLLNVSAASGFLFDIGLETQFGVVIYALVILCGWKYLKL